ncbi:hypothetical protein [Sulfurimonas sp.]|uniref:hypothetical protein n=1 Tax=Sulfurimonas sp. TaxID=2022749 RepID=UPI003D0CF711
MRFFALIITFSIALMASNECSSCHEQQTQTMTTKCTSCHTATYKHKKDPKKKTSPVTLKNYKHFYNDDKPIIRSYQGLMQKDYGSIEVFHLQSDVHFQKGMICQDCHTTHELHNDEFWSSQTPSEIQCQDCHGTIESYPWELSLKDEDKLRATFDENNVSYLVNDLEIPFRNLVKREELVVVKLASNETLKLKPLKLMKKAGLLSKSSLIAMENISEHLEKLECSSCHSLWAPQFYGSKVIKEKKVVKSAVFSRWEEPFLSQNQSGKIAPAIPKTPLNVVQENILQPYEPHTIQQKSRTCESCHSSSKVLEGSVDQGSFTDENITHFNLSKTLSDSQRDKLDRRGVCLSCHDTIPNGSLSISMVSHISKMTDNVANPKEHKAILSKILYMSAWFEIILVVFGVGVLIYILYTIVIKKKSINPINKGWK